MKPMLHLAAGLLAALLNCSLALAAETYSTGVAEFSAQVQLVTAQNAIAQLVAETDLSQRHQLYSMAITALSSLHQLHGCSWAGPMLDEIYAAQDCPELYFGYSSDGRIALRVERLVLSNPAYTGSSVYLCQLQSNSSEYFEEQGSPRLSFVLEDGSLISPDELSEEHRLWEQLDSLVHTFQPPPILPSGAATAFKQLYVPGPRGTHEVSTVIFNWSDYSFELPVPRGKRNP